MDIRNLGNFTSIEAVWARYPNGGQEGDYLTIAGVKYRWNKYILKWENAEVVTETSGRESTTFSDLHVQNDVIVGGDVKVNGTLRAEHVKQPNVGLFATLAALQAAYPTPEVGMWAVVGNSVPGAVYRCTTEGVWSATGGTGGVDNLENVLLYSQQTLNESQKAQARENIGAQKILVSGTDIKTFGGKSLLGTGDIANDGESAKLIAEALSLHDFGLLTTEFNLTAPRTNYGRFRLEKGEEYTITARIDTAVAAYIAIGLRENGGASSIYEFRIQAGETESSLVFLSKADYEDICISVYSSSWASVGTIHLTLNCNDLRNRFITQVVYAGLTDKAPSSACISSFINKIIETKNTDIPQISKSAGWKLLPSGISARESEAEIRYYGVTAGQILFLHLSKDTDSVYQFQSAQNVPSTTNPNVVGIPISTEADGLVVVPDGATFLVVSALSANTSNKVQLAEPDYKAKLTELVGTLSTEFDYGSGAVAQYTVMTFPYNIVNGHRYSVSIATDDNTNTTYFSTRTSASSTVNTDLGTGIGSRTFEFVATGDALLIALSYRYAGTGAIYNVSITDLSAISLNSIHAALGNLESRIGGGIVMPEYSQSEQKRVYDILIQRSLLDVHIAAFNTDQHFNIDSTVENNRHPRWVMQGVQAMLNIANLLPIDEIVFGGDVAGYTGTTSLTTDGILQTIAYLLQPTHDTNAVVVSLPGNHDAWQNNNQVTAQGMYNVNAKRNQRHLYYKGNGTDNCDAWVDDTEHRIRSIFVDVQSRNVRTEDFRVFLANALATLPEGYMAVCFSHMALTNEFAGVVKAHKISDPSVEIDAFQDPFDCHEILNQYADRIICCINGHTHFDASAVSDSGILYIETTTAAPHTRNYTTDNIPNTSTLGTVTDTSFDFFIIDQAAKTIEAVRYGQGCNRKWIYKGANAGMMSGYPEQIVR